MDDRDKFDYRYPTSKKSKSPKPVDYSGVEYIPSDYAQTKKFSRDPVKPSSERRDDYDAVRPANRSKKKVSSSNQVGLLMGVTIAVGIIICIGAFMLMYSLTRPKVVHTKQPDSPIEVNEGDSVSDELAVLAESDAKTSAVIKGISDGTISLINADDGVEFDAYVNEKTKYKDKFGQLRTLQQFTEGDIVVVMYNSTNKKIEEMAVDSEAWNKSDIKNIVIGTGTDTVKVGNDTFTVSDKVIFLPKGTNPTVIAEDVVTLRGRKNSVHTVVVERRTGNLEFINSDKILDGTVEVNTDIYKALDEAGSLKVLEGNHTVVVKGSNIDVFMKDVTITEGETVTIDLEEAKIKEGVINLKVNEPNYAVLINDNPAVEEPITLPYGTYKLAVTKEGFIPWEGNVNVNGPTVSVTATLTQEVKMGRVTVTVMPEGVSGSVYIDNALIGTAPVSTRVTYGTHQLTVKATGYNDTSIPIIVEGDPSYEVTMHKSASNQTADTSGGASTAGDENTNNSNDTITDPTSIYDENQNP